MLNWLRNLKETRYFLKYGEVEMRLVKYLCHPFLDAIDVGANVGGYIHLMRRHARKTFAFEPNPDFVDILQQKFAGKGVEIRQLALSDYQSQSAVLMMPAVDGKSISGCATVSPYAASTFEDMGQSMICETARLDDIYKGEVGFIKIDVEGHEMAVLDGAFDTISNSRPNILVEIDDNLSPGGIERAIQYFYHHNYRGFYVWKRSTLLPIESFSVSLSQNSANRIAFNATLKHQGGNEYLSNFLFFPNERAISLCSTLLRVI